MPESTCCIVVGTRPEAIKLAPVVIALHAQGDVDVRVISTAQHRELLDDAIRTLGLRIDLDLDLMLPDQSPGAFLGRAIVALDTRFAALSPAVVVGEGDTNTALAAALAAFQRGIPFAHVEAGLRTEDVWEPFPEEANRRLIGRLAALHCAPTSRAADNLRAEGVLETAIAVTGNPVVDALRSVVDRLPRPVVVAGAGRRLILVTVHRRENFGPPLLEIARAIRELAMHGGFEIALPLHPNPRVGATLRAELGGRERIHLVPALDHLGFLALMRSSWIVLSDSGGVQEEAPSFGRPVLVLRNSTERVEGVAAGVARVIGTDAGAIRDAVLSLADDDRQYARMVATSNPYGDGQSGPRIAGLLRARFALGG